MENIKINKNVLCQSIPEMNFDITYSEMGDDLARKFEMHSHSEFEIYFNLSGDVSFMVENTVYPILPGSMIISRPNEWHSCIYNSDAAHKFYWILISCDNPQGIFKKFTDREKGKENLILLSEKEQKKFITLCDFFFKKEISQIDLTLSALEMISLINNAQVSDISSQNDFIDNDILISLKYINEHFKERISAKDIASSANISVNTLERKFIRSLKVSPMKYLKKRRFLNAVNLLKEGMAVQEVFDKSGFADYSHFISEFKSIYGMTPLKYKKIYFNE